MIETIALGALVSALVQWLKNALGTNKAGTLALVAVLSFALAGGAWLLQHYNLWAQFLAIVATASTIYAFIIQHMEDGAAVSQG